VWGSEHSPASGANALRAASTAALVVAAFASVLLPTATRAQPVITDQAIEKAAKKHRMPTEAELARVPVPSAPRIDALPQPRVQRQVDLGAIARGYEAMGQPTPGSSPLSAGPSLLVFVSFAMPELALARLVDQADRSGATLVLRGLNDGSLQQTVLRAQRLIGQHRVGFQIDPQAFDRFSVTATPTFVLLKAGAAPAPCAAGTCFASTQFVSASGDVSIDYALEFFIRSAPSFSREAGAILSKLKGG
jgi:conjugal transfer pilus assembly protein TrbC